MTAKPWIALFCFTLAGIVRQFGCRIESHKRFYSSLQRWQSRHRRRVVNVQNQPWNLWSLRQKCDCLCHRRWMTPRWAESGLCGEKSMCARVCPCVCVCVRVCAYVCVFVCFRHNSKSHHISIIWLLYIYTRKEGSLLSEQKPSQNRNQDGKSPAVAAETLGEILAKSFLVPFSNTVSADFRGRIWRLNRSNGNCEIVYG